MLKTDATLRLFAAAISGATVDTLSSAAGAAGVTLWQMAETVVAPTYGDSAAQKLLKPKPKEALAGFLELIRGLRRASGGATVESTIEAVLEESGLMQFYEDKCGSGARELRWDGLGWDGMR